MENTPSLTINAFKAEAITLRKEMRSEGDLITHSQALEQIARRHGFRDWNTLNAAAIDKASVSPLRPGQAVEGTYLGQDFVGKVRAVSLLGNAYMRVSIHLDHAVDVVQFASFSSWRRRISGTIRPDGISPSRCSDNTPHLVVFNT